MQSVRIILLCILAAVTYGIIHDQVTARICVEYFTVGHPPVFPTEDPTLLGIGWGIIATWWVGLFLGIPLAVVARAGPRPKRSAASLVKPIACLLVVMAVCAALAGLIGWVLAQNGVMNLDGRLAEALPADRHKPFLIDAWAHAASYLSGLVGGIVVMIVVWRSRDALARAAAGK
jgi:hypothetical protein